MRRFTVSFALGCALAHAGAAYAVTVGEAVPALIAVSQGEDPQSLAELFLSDAMREPDDGPGAANDLGSGVSAQGVLDPATDVQDWFTRRIGSLEDGPRICFRSTGSLTFTASDGGGMLGGATQTQNGGETCFAFPRLGSGAFDWTVRFSAPSESGTTYAFDITTSTTEITGEQSTGAVTVAAGERLVLKDGATLNAGGDFACAGRLEVEGGDGRINVAGDALLACPLAIEPPGPAPAPGGKAEGDPRTLALVVEGTIRARGGFSPFTSGSVLIADGADSPLLAMTPAEIEADAESDAGEEPAIVPVREEPIPPAPPPVPALPRRKACTGGTHTFAGAWPAGGVPPPALDQDNPGGPVVVAVWTECDVEFDGSSIDPPSWKPRDPADADTSMDPMPGEANAQGADGRKGRTLNVRTSGKMTFKGRNVWTLMDGADGQDATATGCPAVALGGKGGTSGGLKARAGSFDLSAGTLRIQPGSGGDGGGGTANGLPGMEACPGTPGCDASGTGGEGASETKKLTIRGVPASQVANISLGGVYAGDGGKGVAEGGEGGDGTDGPPGCHGGKGGDGDATGGKGGDAALSTGGQAAGAGLPAVVQGGWGGNGESVGGMGGMGGLELTIPCPVLPSGNGGMGGASDAVGGCKGASQSTGLIAPEDGAPDAGGGGPAGFCDIFPAVGGVGGAWTETQCDGTMAAGKAVDTPDCPCPPAVAEMEPNNLPDTATGMDLADVGTGVLDPPGADVDFWMRAIPEIEIETDRLQLCVMSEGLGEPTGPVVQLQVPDPAVQVVQEFSPGPGVQCFVLQFLQPVDFPYPLVFGIQGLFFPGPAEYHFTLEQIPPPGP